MGWDDSEWAREKCAKNRHWDIITPNTSPKVKRRFRTKNRGCDQLLGYFYRWKDRKRIQNLNGEIISWNRKVNEMRRLTMEENEGYTKKISKYKKDLKSPNNTSERNDCLNRWIRGLSNNINNTEHMYIECKRERDGKVEGIFKELSLIKNNAKALKQKK